MNSVPGKVQDFLENRWKVIPVTPETKSQKVTDPSGKISEVDIDLKDIESPAGLFKCVDGRPSGEVYGQPSTDSQLGPKALGGVYAIAALQNKKTLKELQKIAKDMKTANQYTSAVHGDCGHGGLGCGFFKLWKDDKFKSLGLVKPEYTADEAIAAVLHEGGAYETLKGEHKEKAVVINYVKGTTLEPDPKCQRFVLDAWVADEFKIDPILYAQVAALTVEMLSNVRTAIIIQSPSTPPSKINDRSLT